MNRVVDRLLAVLFLAIGAACFATAYLVHGGEAAGEAFAPVRLAVFCAAGIVSAVAARYGAAVGHGQRQRDRHVRQPDRPDLRSGLRRRRHGADRRRRPHHQGLAGYGRRRDAFRWRAGLSGPER
ncbi:Sperm protamine P1 (modular protein) [Mesorhizobium metallidurans STM 2683]|uniref:Sperm protamine P1 (Modular protein) n=1 Tax=Mesorhizobium metallidurans STM 2683 TaxID=1297569 RepID=M5EV27_9HYPH|nr:Sperm protamine P1 (modular protein) [Mesorhizobium metallidurans STM 2683]